MIAKHHPHFEPRDVRRMAGWSQTKLSVVAGVGVGLVRLFEANPEAVTDPEKRARLKKLYVGLASLVAS
jgi:hypothetical protein